MKEHPPVKIKLCLRSLCTSHGHAWISSAMISKIDFEFVQFSSIWLGSSKKSRTTSLAKLESISISVLSGNLYVMFVSTLLPYTKRI